ncbi:hypothetical protein D3C71_1155010 [compost metagenome]
MPKRENTDGITPSSSKQTSLMVISEPVIAASPMKEPISIISGNMRCEVPPRRSTPSMVNKLDPIPDILAPMRFNILQSCCKYGSQAALYIVVVPFANTAAITIFAVPVTEASSKRI